MDNLLEQANRERGNTSRQGKKLTASGKEVKRIVAQEVSEEDRTPEGWIGSSIVFPNTKKMPKQREKSKYEEVCAVVPNQIMAENEKAKRTKEMGLVFQLGIGKAVVEHKLLK
ncbi:predicted protein [Histoplasma capsulatum G186AR]|uniref:Uncharacterized protein n=1 Tax=Ajellomyces capsulatus (strain G186AR / H82 / ATCC MYA-2454 / RMSCC 2432) TaxID=447093 RepID=C0NHW4_AJECG|nr:uncharacterized protein HCBG_02936 [Histoplasma capsulatum G186AR]EEH09399.1 predicted protein [Histoplasma capsulatum G186AR]